MSLLNTFAILFETDAKKAVEDIGDLDKVLKDTEEAASSTADEMDNFGNSSDGTATSVSGLVRSMAGLAAAYITVGTVSSNILGNAFDVDRIGKFSETMGESITEIDNWGAAVERKGGSADAFRGAVEGLNTSLADIQINGGGEAITTLAMLGVNATDASGKIKSAFDVLPEISDAFQNLSEHESFSFGKKLGLDQGTILLLQQGRVAVEDLVDRQGRLGGVTEEGYQAAAKFNAQWNDTKRVFNSLWMSANSTILPALEKVLIGVQNLSIWVKENKDLVVGFFGAVAGVLTAVYLPVMIKVATATLAAIAPFIAIAAAITAVSVAIAIVYEDFKAWTSGTSSLLGDLFGEFEDFKNKVLDVGRAIGDFFKTGLFGSDISVENTQKATQTIGRYGSNPMNNGGGNSSVSNKTQSINVSMGETNIDARGMDRKQAEKMLTGSFQESIRMAVGQLSDGVSR